ncbi:hypothetical protein GCK32_022587, partial [Trichostrongylus colubriformis]
RGCSCTVHGNHSSTTVEIDEASTQCAYLECPTSAHQYIHVRQVK